MMTPPFRSGAWMLAAAGAATLAAVLWRQPEVATKVDAPVENGARPHVAAHDDRDLKETIQAGALPSGAAADSLPDAISAIQDADKRDRARRAGVTPALRADKPDTLSDAIASVQAAARNAPSISSAAITPADPLDDAITAAQYQARYSYLEPSAASPFSKPLQ